MAGANGEKTRRQGIWNSSKVSAEQKRARNRESQRSFRERRMLRLQELEAQVQSLSAGKDERDAELIAENKSMKEAWVRAKQQMSHMDMMLQNLKDTLYTGLDRSKSSLSVQGSSNGTPADGCHKSSSQQNYCDEIGAGEEEDDPICPEHHKSMSQPRSLASESPRQRMNESRSMDIDLGLPHDSSFQGPTEFSLDAFEWPIVSDFIDGPPASQLHFDDIQASYDDLGIMQLPFTPHVASGEVPLNIVPNPPEFELQLTALNGHLPPSGAFMQMIELQSVYHSVSELLEVMETTLVAYIQSLGEQVTNDFLDKACLVFMIFFTRYVWPGPPELFFGTFCYAMAEQMVLWRIEKANRSHTVLPLYLTPSKLQLSTQHPLMLGWVGITPLRERMIENFKTNSDSDQVWLDLMAYSVVEIEEISALITGVGHGRGFLGTWNIFEVFGGSLPPSHQEEKTSESEIHGGFPELSKLDNIGLLRVYRMQLPDTPDVATDTASRLGRWEPVTLQQLFSSPMLAKKLYYHLELYNSHKLWRLDPAFFKKYENLTWEGYQKYTARGICLRSPPRSLSVPIKESRENLFQQFQTALFNIKDSMTL